MNTSGKSQFVSRAGLKLDHALREFGLDVTGLYCADFGCNVGGFTDCLLKRGAAKVYAIDTGYGTLDYRLRMDERVVVMERANALHVAPPWEGEGKGGKGRGKKGRKSKEVPPHPQPLSHPRTGERGEGEGVNLVTIDLAWTPQRLAIPAALKWLTVEREPRLIISLIKPHYEVTAEEKRDLLRHGRLEAVDSERVFQRVVDEMESYGAQVQATTRSPITGCKSSKKAKGAGNIEYLVLAGPTPAG